MRVVAIYPSADSRYYSPPSQMPHQGLLYICSQIKTTLPDVEICFLDSQVATEEQITGNLHGDILCVSPTNLSMQSTRRYASMAKDSGMFVLLGGDQARNHSQLFLEQCGSVDAVAFENNALGVIEFIKKGNPSAIQTWRSPKRLPDLQQLKQESQHDLEIIHDLDYDICGLEKYQSRPYTIQLYGQRGCLWKTMSRDHPEQDERCSFCNRSTSAYELMSPQSYISAIARFRDLYSNCRFCDRSESLTQNIDWLRSVSDGLASQFRHGESGLSECLSRASDLNHETLQLLKSIGVDVLLIGVESVDNDVLRKVKKGSSLEQIRQRLQLAASYGFRLWLSFILGLPGETERSFSLLDAFIRNLNKKEITFYCTINLIQPLAGSPLYERIARSSRISPEDHFDPYKLQYLYFREHFGDNFRAYEKRRSEMAMFARSILDENSPFFGEGWLREEVVN